MYKISIMVVMLVLIAVSGCKSTQISFIPPISDGKKSYEQFVSSKSFPYSIQKIRKKQIFDNYEKIKIGMSKKEVNLILGEPDCSQYNYTKNYPGRYIGSDWTYFFYKPNPNLVNEKLDRYVWVVFGPNDKADWIEPHNVEGLSEKRKAIEMR